MPSPIATRAAVLRNRLQAIGQAHVLAFWDELSAWERGRLLADLEAVDLEQVPSLVSEFVASYTPAALPDPSTIAPAEPAPVPGAREREAGEELLARGEVAALTVAGGQGTRLGFDGPKGAYPIGPVSCHSFFQLFALSLQAARVRYARAVPWFVMTSQANHDATVAYFAANGHFGLDAASVHFFQQGRMPCLTLDGMLVLAERSRLALSPDGHGGVIEALERSGGYRRMRELGVRHLSMFQVDNAMVRCIDPGFLGAHALAGAELSSKALPKAHPTEGLGNFVRVGGRTMVIEYSEMPLALAEQRKADGTLRYLAGSISIYAIAASFFERLAASATPLPLHRAVKRQAMLDPVSGRLVEGEVVKLERFVFDAVPLASRVMLVQGDREEDFGPVKNLHGADSVETCRRAMVRRAARWLERRGVAVPRDDRGEVLATLEISPLAATEPAELRDLPAAIAPGSVRYIR